MKELFEVFVFILLSLLLITGATAAMGVGVALGVWLVRIAAGV